MRTRQRMHRLILGLGVIVSGVAGAADLDGSTALSCTGVSGYSCDPAKACSKVKPEGDKAPVVLIDPSNKTVKTPYRTDRLPIANSATNNEQPHWTAKHGKPIVFVILTLVAVGVYLPISSSMPLAARATSICE